MEMIAKIHIPTEQYGYCEVEYSFVGGNEDEFRKKMVDDYKLLKALFDEGKWVNEHSSGVNWRSKKMNGKTIRQYMKDGEWING